jgi:hypothetical protein
VSTWHYERGQWTETTFLDDGWPGGADWRTALASLGYEEHLGLGDPTGHRDLCHHLPARRPAALPDRDR